MATYPLATLACTVDANGISSPSYADIYQSLIASFQSVYGSDAYLDPDSQDGQMLAIFARAQYDSNQATIATYNSFAPGTAQGVALSSVVKVNGIRRLAASNSSVEVSLTGTAGTPIRNGLVGDALKQQWALPGLVTIPSNGQTVVTAVATTQGALTADPGTVTRILTPVYGWQSVTNDAPASPGAPIELDAQLRQRQSISVAQPSITPLGSVLAAVANVAGVTRYAAYENDEDFADANGLSPHSMAIVVEGGDAAAIANAILLKKTPGCRTDGTTVLGVIDPAGVVQTIRFYPVTYVPVWVDITIQALPGYSADTGAAAIAGLAAWFAALSIGLPVYYTRLFAPITLCDSAPGNTFVVTGLTIGTAPDPSDTGGMTDIPVAFNQVALCPPANISLTVVPQPLPPGRRRGR